jgi:Domain of unknown function (DUF4331)
MKRALFGALGFAAVASGALVVGTTGNAADHLESPLVKLDGRTDINDVYAFRNGANTVLVMTVNPVAGVASPTTFDPDAEYRFRIDNDGDHKLDRTIEVEFGKVRDDGTQRVEVEGPGGRNESRGWTGSSFELRRGGMATAGVFDDPFFFDLEAFLGAVKGQGTRTFCDAGARNFFEGLNVSAIVVEVPSRILTHSSSTINVWGETANDDGIVDRMGKPAIATVLINDGNEDAFNQTRPAAQLAAWGPEVSANLIALSGLDGDGYDQATADFVTSVLLPDVLTLDTDSDAGFVTGPLNGRQLADDVIDLELAVVTGLFDSGGNGPVLTTDCIANDSAFQTGFPYLAPANP